MASNDLIYDQWMALAAIYREMQGKTRRIGSSVGRVFAAVVRSLTLIRPRQILVRS
jgi:hypothetical protein